MINEIHAFLHAPCRGWDPVTPTLAKKYADATQNKTTIGAEPVFLTRHLGKITITGLDALDLGGGPGHQSIVLAQHGAHVVWHDISRSYQNIAAANAEIANTQLSFTLDYMDYALRIHGPRSFDIVINRICWYYCMNDRAFASMIMDLLRPGGVAIIDNYIPVANRCGWRYTLNRLTGYKIGHPFPAPGIVPALFARLSPSKMEVLQTRPDNELITIVK